MRVFLNGKEHRSASQVLFLDLMASIGVCLYRKSLSSCQFVTRTLYNMYINQFLRKPLLRKEIKYEPNTVVFRVVVINRNLNLIYVHSVDST